ncbi:PQQ-dependent sugar dehydrogenase, partial [Pseudomonadota bacterium]
MLRPVLLLITLYLAIPAWAQETEVPFQVSPVATFNEPWAMTFLPDGRMLVTEKRGRLYIVDQEGEKSRPVEEVPNVDYRGQGGLGDVILHPDFENNSLVYLSYAESGVGNVRGAAVARARLVLTKGNNRLEDVEVIWRQNPKVTDDGHYGHRMIFDSEGYL